MEKRVLLLGVAALFVISLSGCSTASKKKDLEVQGLRNQVSALEAQPSAKTEEVSSSTEQITSKSSETSASGSLEKSGETNEQPTGRQIQAALKNAGYYKGTIDGKLGRKTRKAVKEFQKANNLKADGKVGPKTWTALKEFLQKKEK